MKAKHLVRALALAAVVAVGFAGQAQARDLRININADPEMIDPITFSALIAGDVLRHVYENFTRVDENGKILPALALKWTISPDNLNWRFELRPSTVSGKGYAITSVLPCQMTRTNSCSIRVE